jgi:hypothetical protein
MNKLFLQTFKILKPIRPGDGETELELSYDSQDDIPAGYEGLYTEKDGKQILTRVKGLATRENVTRLESSLQKERNDHKGTKQKYAALTSHGTIDEVVAKLDSIPELEARAAGVKEPAQIDALVNAKVAPLQRTLDQANQTIAALKDENAGFKQKEVNNKIKDAVTSAATSLKLKPEAIADAIMYGERVLTLDESGNVVTRDGVGITPYLDPKSWLEEIVPTKQHWIQDSFGGGSQGGKGGVDLTGNPYSPDNWSVTDQMALYKKNPDKARQMAARFGVDVMNPQKPAKKA